MQTVKPDKNNYIGQSPEQAIMWSNENFISNREVAFYFRLLPFAVRVKNNLIIYLVCGNTMCVCLLTRYSLFFRKTAFMALLFILLSQSRFLFFRRLLSSEKNCPAFQLLHVPGLKVENLLGTTTWAYMITINLTTMEWSLNWSQRFD